MAGHAHILEDAESVVIKIGSALLVDDTTGIRQDWLNSLTADIAALVSDGKRVLIVSSGAIALGRRVLGLPRRALKLDESQAAAAVGQIQLGRAWSQALGTHDLVAGQILLTLHDTEGKAGRRTYLNARDTIGRMMKFGAVPVINENDTIATSEIRYGDNDRLAARVATMMGADLLVLLSDVDGLYTAPPAEDASASYVDKVVDITPEIESMAGSAGSALSRGGMVTKVEAAKIATEAGTSMLITSGKRDHPVQAILDGERSTLFCAKPVASRARKTWIAGQLETAGLVRVDEGAAAALAGGKSLLPAGVTAIEGQFNRGDAVTIVGPNGTMLGQGLIAYDDAEARKIMGLRSQEWEAALGYEGRSALIHRDDMALTALARGGARDKMGES